MKKLLSLDGGGVRGLISVMLLKEIENRTGKKIIDLFDFFSGTSTGGIIALLIVAGYSTDDILSFYTGTEVKKIFSPFSILTRAFHGYKYPSDNIEGILNDRFKSLTLKNAVKPVLIPSYDLISRESVFFYSGSSIHKNLSMADVARCTSAAPTYFSPKKLSGGEFIDGGIICNNPTIAALVEFYKQFDEKPLAVSIGTGSSLNPINGMGNAYPIKWASVIIDCFSDANSDATDHEAFYILDEYFRFQVKIAESTSKIDDASDKNLNALKELVTSAVKNEWSSKLDELCIQVLTPSTQSLSS